MKKPIAWCLLAPAMALTHSMRIQCKENSLDNSLGETALKQVDRVIIDDPIPPGLNEPGTTLSHGIPAKQMPG